MNFGNCGTRRNTRLQKIGEEVSLLVAKSCTIGSRGSHVPGITSLNTGKPWAPLDEVYRNKTHGSQPLVF